MAVVDIDGFDMYNGLGAETGLGSRHFVTSPSAMPVSLIAGRFGGQAIRISNGTGIAAQGMVTKTLAGGSAYNAFTHGFACRRFLPTVETGGPDVWWMNGATAHCGFKIKGDGTIEALRSLTTSGGTLIGTSTSGVITDAAWHYIEVEVVISATVGMFRMWVDDIQVLNLANVVTQNGATTTVNTLRYNNNNTSNSTARRTVDFDDAYFTDSATRLGERRVETVYPNGDVNSGFTPLSGASNALMVDETLVDGDTTYVQASTVGDRDTYNLGNLSTIPTTVDAVQLSAWSKKTDAGARSIALQAVSGATTSDGPNYSLPSTTYTKQERLMITDPNTGLAWTGADVNALTAGPKVTI
jgi:hypothetical protein